jgi:hypothetical protein
MEEPLNRGAFEMEESMIGKTLRIPTLMVAALLVLAGCGDGTGAAEDEAGTAGESAGGAAAQAPAPQSRIIPTGTTLAVELGQTLSAANSEAGQTFTGRIANAVVVDGQTLIPAGAEAEGRILEASESGRVSGVATIQLTLTSVSVGGQSVELATGPFEARAETSRTEDATRIGIGAGIGAAIGAIAGGGDGAALGAAIGGGGGTAVVLATRGDDIELPSGTAINFILSQNAQVR